MDVKPDLIIKEYYVIDSTTIDSFKVHCNQCGWDGTMGQLQFTCVPIGDPADGDTSAEPCCPKCKSVSWIEKEE